MIAVQQLAASATESGATESGATKSEASERPPFLLSVPAQVLALVVMLVGGAAAGIALGSEAVGSKEAVILGGALVGVAMALVAATRFWALVLLLFVVRSSIDALKIGKLGEASSALDPGIIVGLVFLAAGATWLFAQWRSGLLFKLSWPTRWFFALAASASLSALGSTHHVHSLETSLKIWAGALMWAVLEQAFREKPERGRQILAAAAASLIIPAVVAFQQLQNPAPLEAYLSVSRITGTFVHSNPFASYLVILATVAAAVITHLPGKAKIAAGAVFAVASTFTLFTYARGAWIALVLGLIVIGVRQDRRILLAIVAGLLVVIVAVPSVTSRLSDLNKDREVGKGDPNSLAWRITYWERLLPLTIANPITGIGLEEVLLTQPEKLQPHNVFVQTTVETGLLGLGSLIGLAVSSAMALGRAMRKAKPGLERGIVIGGAGAALGVLSQLASENLLTQAAIHWYLGAAVAFALMVAQREATASPTPSTSSDRHGPDDVTVRDSMAIGTARA